MFLIANSWEDLQDVYDRKYFSTTGLIQQNLLREISLKPYHYLQIYFSYFVAHKTNSLYCT